ncbi:hypothetical protein PVBG_05995 [Plasmodium vivax Brazil I]|uniref:VIR protein n=1 Tax=Plasmodium vivax (strain Brazil I) TaxID=1033975 RepID=A0A0J9T066_PLAV1|nr:hypothetical protein PVBG_05995 [Plasmodium vivax Brazil I]
MRRSATDNDLLYYEKYLNLKERFNNEYTKNDRINPDELLNDTEFNISNKLILRPVFAELLRHIRNSGIFLTGQDQPCSYISYILSKDVKSTVGEYETETFDIFKKFVNKYSSQAKHKASICSDSLLYVNSEMYEQMNNLYVLYEEYKKLIKYQLAEKKACSAIYSFLHQYKEFLWKYPPTNIRYKNILEEFDKEIKYRVPLYNTHACPEEHFNIENIKITISPEANKPKASVPIEHQPKHAEYRAPQAQSPSPQVELSKPLEELRTADVELQAPLTEYKTPHEGSLPSRETLVQSVQPAARQEVQGLAREETYQRELRVNSLPEYTPTYGPLESPRISTSSEHYPYPPVPLSSNEVELPPSSFMNTITSTLKNIDPYPVVGVSGGMGALFLLFRVLEILNLYPYF